MGAIKMLDNQDKNLEAIAKLLFLTQQGKIKWMPDDPNSISKVYNDEIISSAFSATYREKPLRIYKRKYKTLKVVRSLAGVLGGISMQEILNPPKETVVVSDIVLEITDKKGNGIWQFPDEQILGDLLEAIKYKASGAQDLIDSLLSEDIESDTNLNNDEQKSRQNK
jgi:hypothetical protein